MENTYWNENGELQDTLNKFNEIMPIRGKFLSNEFMHEMLNECLMINNIYYDFHNNGLCNVFEIPDFDHWERNYSEYVNEYGDMEEEEVISWEEHYSEELEIKPDYRDIPICQDIYDFLDNHTLSDLQDIVNSDIEQMLENELTKYLSRLEPEITQRFEDMKYTIEKLESLVPNIPSTITNLQKLEIAMYKNENNMINIMSEDTKLNNGLRNIIQQDITNIGNAPLLLVMKYDNILGISDEYKQYPHRIKEYFSKFDNIKNDSELKQIILSNDNIYEKLLVHQPLTSGEDQVVAIANKRYESISFSDVDKMNEKEFSQAQKLAEKIGNHIDEDVKQLFEQNIKIQNKKDIKQTIE